MPKITETKNFYFNVLRKLFIPRKSFYICITLYFYLREDSLEGLFEEGRVETVTHNHVAASIVATGFHLQQTCLVQSTRENVNGVTVVGCPFSQP